MTNGTNTRYKRKRKSNRNKPKNPDRISSDHRRKPETMETMPEGGTEIPTSSSNCYDSLIKKATTTSISDIQDADSIREIGSFIPELDVDEARVEQMIDIRPAPNVTREMTPHCINQKFHLKTIESAALPSLECGISVANMNTDRLSWASKAPSFRRFSLPPLNFRVDVTGGEGHSAFTIVTAGGTEVDERRVLRDMTTSTVEGDALGYRDEEINPAPMSTILATGLNGGKIISSTATIPASSTSKEENKFVRKEGEHDECLSAPHECTLVLCEGEHHGPQNTLSVPLKDSRRQGMIFGDQPFEGLNSEMFEEYKAELAANPRLAEWREENETLGQLQERLKCEGRIANGFEEENLEEMQERARCESHQLKPHEFVKHGAREQAKVDEVTPARLKSYHQIPPRSRMATASSSGIDTQRHGNILFTHDSRTKKLACKDFDRQRAQYPDSNAAKIRGMHQKPKPLVQLEQSNERSMATQDVAAAVANGSADAENENEYQCTFGQKVKSLMLCACMLRRPVFG